MSRRHWDKETPKSSLDGFACDATDYQSDSCLPIWPYKGAILDCIRNRPVTCIQGDTGCGKSTQVPKFIYEAAKATGSFQNLRIVVTQPRRISCIALARRVAEDLGCEIGKDVGFAISGNSFSDSKTKILYMTCGYFLQLVLHQPDAISRYSHIILDEIHERSIEADLLSLVIKRHLIGNAFKLVVMSATMEGDLFSKYFTEEGMEIPPTLRVGQKRFPITTYYLDDLLSLDTLPLKCTATIASQVSKFNTNGRALRSEIIEGSEDIVLSLIEAFSVPGESILIFLPGMQEIHALYDALGFLGEEDALEQDMDGMEGSNAYDFDDAYDARSYYGNGDHGGSREDYNSYPSWYRRYKGRTKFKFFGLHSLMPIENHEMIFKAPAKDTVHIFLATTIAESALTLPNVRVVLDFCLRKCVVYDQHRKLSVLTTLWSSKASSSQRSGRTGRVFEGISIRLVTRRFYDTMMPEFETADMLREPLDKLYLQAKLLSLKLHEVEAGGRFENLLTLSQVPASELLAATVQPPNSGQVEEAIRSLHTLGALTSPDEEAGVTMLGRLALHLPVDLSLCRLVLLSITVGLPLDGIIISACLTIRDPFTMPHAIHAVTSKDYTSALARSFVSRLAFDGGSYSEIVMLRNLFVDFVLHLEKAMSTTEECGDVGGYEKPIGRRRKLRFLSRSYARTHAVSADRLLDFVGTVADYCLKLEGILDPKSCKQTLAKIETLLTVICPGREKTDSNERFILADLLQTAPRTVKSLVAVSFERKFLRGSHMDKAFMEKIPVDARSRALCYPKLPSPLRNSTTFRKAVEPTSPLGSAMDVTIFPRDATMQGQVIFPGDSDSFRKNVELEKGKLLIKMDTSEMDEWYNMCLPARLALQYGAGRCKFSLSIEEPSSPRKVKGRSRRKVNGNDIYEVDPQSSKVVPVEILAPFAPYQLQWRSFDWDAAFREKEKTKRGPLYIMQYRNPVGCVAPFLHPGRFSQSLDPASSDEDSLWSHSSDSSEPDLIPETPFGCVLAVYARELVVGVAGITRIDGVSLLSSRMGQLLFLATVPPSDNMRLKVKFHPLYGAVITALHIGAQSIPIMMTSIKLSKRIRSLCDPKIVDLDHMGLVKAITAENPILTTKEIERLIEFQNLETLNLNWSLTVEDFLIINQFRENYLTFVEDLESLEVCHFADEFAGQLKVPEKGLMKKWFARLDNLCRLVNMEDREEYQQFDSFTTESFLELMRPLAAESCNGQGKRVAGRIRGGPIRERELFIPAFGGYRSAGFALFSIGELMQAMRARRND